MKMIYLKYNKKKKIFIVKIKNKLLFNFVTKNKIKNNYNISIICYNYFLFLKLLRIFGLINPFYNILDFNY